MTAHYGEKHCDIYCRYQNQLQTIIKMTGLYFVTYNTHTVGQDSEQDGKWPYSGTAGAIQAWE